MPELPDVEIIRRAFEDRALHREITDVAIGSPRIVEGTSADRLATALRGRAFERARRHGKHLFASLDDGRALALHFGMTGRLAFRDAGDPEPDHTRASLWMGDRHVALVMPRKLGRLGLVDDVDAFIAEKEMGPDALDEELDLDAFREALAGRTAQAKSALMNQRIVAGIGNVYADEILFQARIDPRTKVSDLPDDRVAELFDAMQEVLRTAIECEADPERFPDGYLTPHREAGEPCPRCGGEVRRIEVGGRSTFYCPDCQT